MDVAIIGGGFGGLLSGARLRQAGIRDIRIIEKGGDFGGTWYWNRYPGAQCDIEAYIYLPLLEDVGYMPTERYARAPEIMEYSRAIARKFDLYSNACFQTEVKELRWDDDQKRWIIITNRGDRMRARFVVMSNGPLNRPKLPDIDGDGWWASRNWRKEIVKFDLSASVSGTSAGLLKSWTCLFRKRRFVTSKADQDQAADLDPNVGKK